MSNTTWQDILTKSAALHNKSAEDKKKSATLLWTGAKTGITEWLPGSDEDVSAEVFQSTVMGILGKSRKGDVSKIKTVALAVKNNGLDLDAKITTGTKAGQPLYPSLTKAYEEARRLTQTVAKEAAEDDAADAAVASIAADAPNSTSTPEGAAKIVLAKGLDEAARLLLDALGPDNEAAHRSFLRAVSAEVAGRVKPKTQPKAAAGPKAGATQAKTGTPAKAAPAKAQPTKAKPVSAAARKASAALADKAAEKGVAPIQKAKPVGNIDAVRAAAPLAATKATPVVKRPARAVTK